VNSPITSRTASRIAFDIVLGYISSLSIIKGQDLWDLLTAPTIAHLRQHTPVRLYPDMVRYFTDGQSSAYALVGLAMLENSLGSRSCTPRFNGVYRHANTREVSTDPFGYYHTQSYFLPFWYYWGDSILCCREGDFLSVFDYQVWFHWLQLYKSGHDKV
jgi:hypothetical protein